MIRAIPNLKLFLMLTFASAIIFGSDKVGLLNTIKKITFYLTNPISFGIYKTYQDFSKQFQFILNLKNQARQDAARKAQISDLLSENAGLKKRLSEMEAQVTQTQYIDPATFKLIAARPIGLTRYLKLDKGSAQGIKIGQAAVYKDNLMGKIIKVEEKSSFVQLLSDPESKVSAFSLGLEGKAKGVVVGRFGTEAVMDKILHEEKISQGNLVYSEGLEEYLPRGLILGKVLKVEEGEGELFKQAKLEPTFDLRDLDLVFVIQE